MNDVKKPTEPLPEPPGSVATVSVRWFDVCQQLPDSDQTVMIHCPIADDDVWLGYHDGKTWRQLDGESLEEIVDHWAQLPEPPPMPWHVNRPQNDQGEGPA